MRLLVLATALSLAAGGCGSRAASLGSPAGAGDGHGSFASLRLALARSPRSVSVNRSLAWLQLRRGRPGAALRHFEVLVRRAALNRTDRSGLAKLYVTRARERMRLGDGSAYRDLERAQKLDGTVVIESDTRAQAYAAAALASLAVTDPATVPRAARFLTRGGTSLDQVKRGLVAPERAPMASLAKAALWAYRGGARRAGLRLLERYAARGGDDRQALAALVDGRRWWGQASPGLLLIDQLRDLVDVCGLATSLAAFGCSSTVSEAARTRTASLRLLGRARAWFWRDERPSAAAAWVVIALRGRVDHLVPSWSAEVAARVDTKGLEGAALTGVAAFAAPTLLRVRGNSAAAQVALNAVIAGASSLRPVERAVVLAEAVAQRRPAAEVQAVARSGPLEQTGLTIAAAHARTQAGEAARLVERQLVARMSIDARRRYLLHHGDIGPLAAADSRYTTHLARWYRAAARMGLADARDRMMRAWNVAPAAWPRSGPFGLVDPLRARFGEPRPSDGALIDIAHAYQVAPARADRLAEDFVDRDVAIGSRGPEIARLFTALGDNLRARRWWQRIAASSPDHWLYQYGAGISAAAVGDLPHAHQRLIAAVAAAGDPGAAARNAVASLLGLGHHLSALSMGKRALELTAPVDHNPVLAQVAQAAARLGRTRVAHGAVARFIAHVNPAGRAEARRYLARRWPRAVALPPVLSPAGARRAVRASSDGSLTWRMAGAGTGRAAMARLLAIAVTAAPPRALRALARLADQLPTPEGRAAARAEQRGLRALMVTWPGGSSR